ncbi:MAG: pilus assembly protein [Planctomycetaceae bacterium]|jgi:TadE-like protein|nr:pilus assembly protein [Planctomycetaceae bacterium]MBV8555810.1 pilus assembly protein [Planctomycetaceae bacterium]
MRFYRSRSGSVLVEFALIALLSYIAGGAVLTYGLMMYQANMVQQAVDAGAQEIARMPLPAKAWLGLSLNTPTNADSSTVQVSQPGSTFNTQIYDERWLYVPATNLGNQTLLDYAAQNFPLINRLLVPAMIYDSSLAAYRYPGAVVENSQTGNMTVLVPIVNYSSSTITWVMPVEEVLIPDNQGNYYSQFNAIPPSNAPQNNFVPGMVALRINYPSQSASMSGFQQPATPGGPTMGSPILADDSSLVESNSLSHYTLVVGDNAGFSDDGVQIHGGKYGLGRQLAYAQQLGVRPYREVISAQAVYRREAFQ